MVGAVPIHRLPWATEEVNETWFSDKERSGGMAAGLSCHEAVQSQHDLFKLSGIVLCGYGEAATGKYHADEKVYHGHQDSAIFWREAYV